jgi:hypothetical protein
VVSAALIPAVLTIAPAAAQAADAKHFGVGTACALSNVLYGPAKLIVALVGGLTSGLAYAVTAGDVDVMRTILDSSVMGDYVIEPAHILGEKQLEFIGNATPAPVDDWSVPPPDQNSGF